MCLAPQVCSQSLITALLSTLSPSFSAHSKGPQVMSTIPETDFEAAAQNILTVIRTLT